MFEHWSSGQADQRDSAHPCDTPLRLRMLTAMPANGNRVVGIPRHLVSGYLEPILPGAKTRGFRQIHGLAPQYLGRNIVVHSVGERPHTYAKQDDQATTPSTSQHVQSAGWPTTCSWPGRRPGRQN